MNRKYFQQKKASAVIKPEQFGFDWRVDASKFSSLTLIGDDVSRMNDISPGGSTDFITGVTERPEYILNVQNGLPGLHFNGSKLLFGVQNFAASDSDTFFFVFQDEQNGPSVNGTLFFDYGSPTVKTMGFVTRSPSAIKGFTVRDGNSDELNVAPALTALTSIAVMTREPGKITVDLNGVRQETTGTYIATSYELVNRPWLGVRPGALFGQPNIAGTWFKGFLFEAARAPRVMGLPEIELLRLYALRKWRT